MCIFISKTIETAQGYPVDLLTTQITAAGSPSVLKLDTQDCNREPLFKQTMENPHCFSKSRLLQHCSFLLSSITECFSKCTN